MVLNEWIWRNIWFMGKAKLGTPKPEGFAHVPNSHRITQAGGAPVCERCLLVV